MHYDFQTSAHAKCILAGEHAVLRGCPALVLPISKMNLNLHYQDSELPLEVECHVPYEQVFLVLFWGIFRIGLKNLGKDIDRLHGKFILENNIPMGAGIGFSSALCVVISRWFIWKKWLKQKDLFTFARHLEDYFHGKSSGVDIAGAMSELVIHFEKSGEIHEVKQHWKPMLYISYSGHTKNTEQAVNHVRILRKKHPKLAKLIDKDMKKSVLLIEKGFKMDAAHGLVLLTTAIECANHCFEKWHLITPELQQHINALHDLGAVAIKPTGAGVGGYVLSLWNSPPPTTSAIEFIPIFSE